MADRNVQIPDEMYAFLERRAAAIGMTTASEYVRMLVEREQAASLRSVQEDILNRWMADGDVSDHDLKSLAPELAERAREALAARLVQALDSGASVPLTKQDFQSIRARLEARGLESCDAAQWKKPA